MTQAKIMIAISTTAPCTTAGFPMDDRMIGGYLPVLKYELRYVRMLFRQDSSGGGLVHGIEDVIWR